MPHCSSSDQDFAQTLAATIDDVLGLVSASTPNFDEFLSAAEVLRPLEPSLVFLILQDGQVVLVHDRSVEAGRDSAVDVARRLTGLAPGRTHCIRVDFDNKPQTALAVSLATDAGSIVLVCLVAPAELPDSPGNSQEISKSVMLGALTWVAATIKAENFQMLARAEQLAAGHEALQESYARSLTKAVEEREERLREQEEHTSRLKAVMMTAADGIVTVDANGSIESFNAAAAEIFGYAPEEAIGSDVSILFPHNDKSSTGAFYDCLSRRNGSGRHASAHELLGQRKDGTAFPLELAVSDVALENRTIITAILRDITQRKALESQLIQAQKLESIGQLAAGIAHEINTPTQFIGDNLRFLKDAFTDLQPIVDAFASRPLGDDTLPTGQAGVGHAMSPMDPDDVQYLLAEVPNAISQALEGVERVATIVRSMKEFSHPGSDEMQTVDLNRAIESTLTVCRNEWKYVADVVTDLDPVLPPVTCLPGECNQVFLNLIINASHAIAEKLGNDTRKKGTITVGTRNLGDAVEIRIADTGTGIPEENRRKVFDPFFTTKQVGRGTGQGLAIARSVIVDKHGGSLTFESEVGQGTTFVVRLPQSSQ